MQTSEGRHDQTVDTREYRTHPSRSTSAENLEEHKIAPPIHTKHVHIDRATILIFVVNGNNAVNSFVMRSEHGRAA